MISKDSDIIKDQKYKTYYEQLDIQTLISDFDQCYQHFKEKSEQQSQDFDNIFFALCDASKALQRIKLHQLAKYAGVEMNCISESQQRLLKVMFCLFEHPVDGLHVKEIAGQVETSVVNVLLDLANLSEADIVEQTDTDIWRLTSLLPKTVMAMIESLEKKQARLKKLKHEFISNSK